MEEKLNWGDLFQGKLKEKGFCTDDVHTIYRLEMDLRAFFDFGDIMPDWMRLQNIERGSKEIRYTWTSSSDSAICPNCGHESTSNRSEYDFKTVQDIPQTGLAVYHDTRVNKYDCNNSECPLKMFAERLPTLTEEKARKTKRFKEYCIARAAGSGCNRAEADIRREGGIISNDSICRYIKTKSAELANANLRTNVRVLSVDDFNLRKGDNSTGCTVFVDGDTRRVLILIKGTTKDGAINVMKRFQTAEMLSRDRATSYSSAGKELGLTQVADRFHLIDNAQKAVNEALSAELPARIYVRSGDGWISSDPEVESAPGAVQFQVSAEDTEERIRLAGLTPSKSKKYMDTLRMLELDSAGLRTAQIADSMGESLSYIRGLRRGAVDILQHVSDRIANRAEAIKNLPPPKVESPGMNVEKTVSGKRVRPAGESIVEPYRETVVTMWKAGGNHRTIHPALVEIGFEGSKNAIYQYILKLKKESPEAMEREKPVKLPDWADEFDLDKAENLPDATLESVQRDDVYSDILKQAREIREKEKSEKEKSEKVTDLEEPILKTKEPNEPRPVSAKKPKGSRPASAKTSPLPPDILDLMFGPEEAEAEAVADTKPEAEKKTRSARH